MTAAPVTNREGSAGRAGAATLSLLAAPYSVPLIKGLASGPRTLAELRRHTGSPPQTTMRSQLRTLARPGIIEKRRKAEFPGAVDYRLTAAGQDLLEVAEVLASWLTVAPDRPVIPGSVSARGAIKALIEGWTTGMMRALASRPLSLTELDRVIRAVSYPSLERRLSSMRLLGLVEAVPGQQRNTPYAVTAWLRSAIAPLASAARWERRWLNGQAPAITNRDVEAAFLLTLPSVRMPLKACGTLRLAVNMDSDREPKAAGVIAQVGQGSVIPAGTQLQAHANAWAHGSSSAWLAAVIEGNASSLELGGETSLAAELVAGLHSMLFAHFAPDKGRTAFQVGPAPTR